MSTHIVENFLAVDKDGNTYTVLLYKEELNDVAHFGNPHEAQLGNPFYQTADGVHLNAKENGEFHSSDGRLILSRKS